MYDRDEVYLFNGLDFVMLRKSNTCITNRDDIDLNTIKDEEHHIVTTNINNNARIRLSLNDKQAKATLPFVECDVKYVTQMPYKGLCWAACIAMVKNYKSGTSLTASDVSRAYFGTFKDEGLSNTGVQDCMQRIYGLNYTYRNTALKENVIFSNLKRDWPVIGRFTYTNGAHMCVIYMDNPFSNFICIMDPECDSVAVPASDGKYTYVSSYSGVTLTLTSGWCYSWVDE